MVKLGEVAGLLNGFAFDSKKFSQEQGTPLIRIRDVRSGTTSTFYDGGFDSKYLIHPGEIIVGMDGDFICSRWGEVPALLNQRVCKVYPKSPKIDGDYLYFALPRLLREIWIRTPFVTVKHLSSKVLLNASIPLPPLREQKRIAGILEASARQINHLQAALESLRQVRSSLIEGYCSTFESTINLDSLAEVTGGLSLSGKRALNPIECEYLRVANIQRNRFLIDDLKTIRCTEKELDRCLVEDGDILMLEANANPYEVGRAAIVETTGHQFVFQNHLFRIRPLGISSIVLNALLDSTFVRSQLLRVVKTTSGLNTMTINQARSLKVPQCEPAANQLFELQLESLSRQTRRVQEKQDLFHELHNSLATRAFAWGL